MKTKRIMAGIISVLMTGSIGISAAAEKTSVEASDAEAAKKLENSTVKYLAHYELATDDYVAERFKKQYGGKLKWYPTTWDRRYSDLAVYVLGDEGIDIFPLESETFPVYAVSKLFQPIDKYVDIPNSEFKRFKKSMEYYNFGGDHYALITDVGAADVVLYNKKTVKRYSLDDPYTLWKKGKWNWDVFEKDLEIFCAADEDNEGLDGWWFKKPILNSTGTPLISTSKGVLKSNLTSKSVTEALDFGKRLYDKGLICDFEKYGWGISPQKMGDGTELFYITGAWAVMQDPATWDTKIPPKDLGMVPVPSPKGSENYLLAEAGGFGLCTGSRNPKGAVAYAECCIAGNFSSTAQKKWDDNLKKNFKWSSEVRNAYKKITAAARENPVIDFSESASNDITTVMQSEVYDVFVGKDPKNVKKDIAPAVKELLEEVNGEFD